MTKANKNKYITAAILGTIIVLGLGLHLYRINYPNTPVFDEVHFATYSADYITGHAFDDIHPPLGKLIYASVLALYPPADLVGAQYVEILPTPGGKGLTLIPNMVPFQKFPYVPLRTVDAIFGAALPIALYFLMRNLDAGRVPSALAAVFMVFDNALLVNTRLILIDGMFLLFGVTALALYFHKKRFVIAGGAVWGLALSVKLTAIVFSGPIIAAFLLLWVQSMRDKQDRKERNKEFWNAARFAGAGFAVLAVIVLLGTFYFSSQARLDALSNVGFTPPKSIILSPQWISTHAVGAYLLADIGEFDFSLGNYVSGDPHDGESPWYFWPAMQAPLFLYSPPAGRSGGDIVLTGNPIVWFGSTFAVIVGLALLDRYSKEYFKKKRKELKPFFVILGGYIIATLPFILIVHRSTFIYHYFPALIFAIALLGWFVGEWLGVREWEDITKQKAFLLAIIVIIVVAGFLHMAPVTYGL